MQALYRERPAGTRPLHSEHSVQSRRRVIAPEPRFSLTGFKQRKGNGKLRYRARLGAR
ncbi:hypothetical protein BGLA2_1610019 [Burkholderia gladioli]|nr:hypothetical protein BGLA2_1610019 [Burkholderia gladioli]